MPFWNPMPVPAWMLDAANWLQNTPMGLWVGGTLWGYPWVQFIHFFGLSVWVGTIVIVDLRLLGIVGQRQTAAQLAAQLTPLTWTGLGIAVTGGFLLFTANPEIYLQNIAFQFKIPLALIGMAYHVVVQIKTKDWGQQSKVTLQGKVAGALELTLWCFVAFFAADIPNH